MLNLKGMFQTSLGRLTGHTDVLEGILAIGFGTAMADGSFTRSEMDKVLAAAKSNPVVTKLFTEDIIETTKDSLIAKLRASGGMEGVWKELRDCAGKPQEIRHAIFTAGVSVANDGGIDDKERAFLDKAASVLNILQEDRDEIVQSITSNSVKFDF